MGNRYNYTVLYKQTNVSNNPLEFSEYTIHIAPENIREFGEDALKGYREEQIMSKIIIKKEIYENATLEKILSAISTSKVINSTLILSEDFLIEDSTIIGSTISNSKVLKTVICNSRIENSNIFDSSIHGTTVENSTIIKSVSFSRYNSIENSHLERIKIEGDQICIQNSKIIVPSFPMGNIYTPENCGAELITHLGDCVIKNFICTANNFEIVLKSFYPLDFLNQEFNLDNFFFRGSNSSEIFTKDNFAKIKVKDAEKIKDYIFINLDEKDMKDEKREFFLYKIGKDFSMFNDVIFFRNKKVENITEKNLIEDMKKEIEKLPKEQKLFLLLRCF